MLRDSMRSMGGSQIPSTARDITSGECIRPRLPLGVGDVRHWLATIGRRLPEERGSGGTGRRWQMVR